MSSNAKHILYLEQLRIRHWIKNVLVFVPAFFTLQIYKSVTDPQLIFAFISFCIASSLIYLFNDLRDIEADKLNPNNKNRPYAAGRLSNKEMLRMILVLSFVLIVGLTISRVWLPIMFYIFINILYSLYLKKIAIIDILVICLGFELRIWTGAQAIHVPLSPWLMVIVSLLALFLVLSKRRSDSMMVSNTKIAFRENISFYQKLPMQSILYGIAAMIMGIYLAYCFSPAVQNRLSNKIYLSSVFVLMGLARYLYVLMIKKECLYPTDIIWKDILLQAIFIAWIVSLLLLIY